MNKHNLGGHSGCQIFLIEEDSGNTFVRKTSKDKDYNERLKIQCEKQMNFKSSKINSPKVYNQGYTDDGLFFFDMEYVQGMTLAEYIKTMEIGKIKELVTSLVTSLVPNTNELIFKKENNVQSVFLKKLSSLRATLFDKDNDVINKSLDLLESHDWGKMISTSCHGDMTLENIIVKNDKLYLIDFLDSFYDSWFLDVGTLLQDVYVMWSYRFQEQVNMNTVLRLIVFHDLLVDEIKKIDNDYVVEIYYALLQKLIRIFPYTNDEQTYNFLKEKTSLVLERISKLEK